MKLTESIQLIIFIFHYFYFIGLLKHIPCNNFRLERLEKVFFPLMFLSYLSSLIKPTSILQ